MARSPLIGELVQFAPPLTLKFTFDEPLVQVVVNETGVETLSGNVLLPKESYAANVNVELDGVRVVHDCAMLAVMETLELCVPAEAGPARSARAPTTTRT